MIPLLINVEVTGKRSKKKKAEFSVNAKDILTCGKGFDETLSRASLLASPRSHGNTFPICDTERGGLL